MQRIDIQGSIQDHQCRKLSQPLFAAHGVFFVLPILPGCGGLHIRHADSRHASGALNGSCLAKQRQYALSSSGEQSDCAAFLHMQRGSSGPRVCGNFGANVRWSDEDWSMLSVLSCKIRLRTIEFREIVVEGQPFVAVPSKHVNLLTIRDEIKTRCVQGKNVCYKLSNGASRTQRSMLIPAGIMMDTEEIHHDDKWALCVDGVVVEMSPTSTATKNYPNPVRSAYCDNLPRACSSRKVSRIYI